MITKLIGFFGILAVLSISGCTTGSNMEYKMPPEIQVRQIVSDVTDYAYIGYLNVTEENNLSSVIVVYEYKDSWLTDDYSRTSRQFSEIFKRIFGSEEEVMIIGLGNTKKVEDEYGNYKNILLARSIMERETYDKINWPNFNHNNLDKVTHFEFYGSSVLKGLRDFRDILEDFA